MIWLLTALLGCAEPAPPPADPTPTPDPPPPTAPDVGTLQVDVIDVGQGDSVLLRTSGGKTALIDAGTGNKGESPLPFLTAAGIDHLDLVIGTHPHADHIGGLDEVLEAIPVKTYLDNGMTHTTAAYDAVMALVESKQVTYRTAKRGQRYKLDKNVQISVMHPGETLLTGTRSDHNSNSVVVRVTHGDLCFLFTGDMEEETEEQLLADGVAPCDVLKVAHHGSAYSTHAPWIAAVQPKLALISVGEGNSYGHPDAGTLARLTGAGAEVFRTDLGGTLHVTSDGRTATVTPERGPGAAAAASGEAAGGADGRLDLNRATANELEALPGVGEVLAQAILSYRAEHGAFGSVDELDAVPGVGDATLEKLRPLVTVKAHK